MGLNHLDDCSTCGLPISKSNPYCFCKQEKQMKKTIDTSLWAKAAEAVREFAKVFDELPEDVKHSLRGSRH